MLSVIGHLVPPDASHLLPALVVLAGIGQLALILASVGIPFVLDWRTDLAKLRPLTRQMFWVYTGYIWCTNLSFGLISTFGPTLLLGGSPLATAVTSFMAIYWVARLLIQFSVLDRTSAPNGALTSVAEKVLVSLFVYLTLVYTFVAIANWRGLGS